MCAVFEIVIVIVCVFVCIISLVLMFGFEKVQHSRWGYVCCF